MYYHFYMSKSRYFCFCVLVLYHLMYCYIFFLYQLMALIKVAEQTFLFNFKKAIGCVVCTTMVSLLF